MKFCPKHWEQLRAAIHARGLDPLVARNGHEAAQRAVDELQGTATMATYDPLMSCYWMICSKALEMGGLYLMTGDYCPVCEALKNHPDPCPEGCTADEVERNWIDGPADAALEHVQEHDELRALLEVITPGADTPDEGSAK